MKNQKLQLKKIGLLTPYTGGNLGDGAIQEAVITNIRARFANVYIHGFTLDPYRTERLLQIPCSPITAIPIRHYHNPPSIKINETISQGENCLAYKYKLKDMIKKVPLLFRFLKLMRNYTQPMVIALTSLLAEIRLIIRSYKMLKSFDLILVSGGGQLDDYWGGAWGHPYNLLKWGIIAKASKTPYFFLSVGTCTFDSRLSELFVKWALKMSEYRSYRDQGSKTLLKHMEFTRNDPVYPDLAFSHRQPLKTTSTATLKRRPVIGISPIAHLSAYFQPTSDLNVYNHYMATLIEFVIFLLKKEYSIVLFHTSGADRYVVKELMETLYKIKDNDTLKGISEITTESVEDLLTQIIHFDCVVASRLHSVILAHLMNLPALAISYDRKVIAHMEDIDQTDFCLDIHKLDLNSLTRTFDSLISNIDNVRSTLAEKTTKFRNSLTTQYDNILNIHHDGIS